MVTWERKVFANRHIREVWPDGRVYQEYDESFTRLIVRQTKSLTSKQKVYLLPGTNTPFRNAGGYEVGRSTATIATGSYWKSTFSGRKATYTGAHNQEGLFQGPHFGPNGVIPVVDSNLKNQSITEALIKLPNGQINLGTALAESKSTINMIASTAGSILKGIRAARRGDATGVARALGVRKLRDSDKSGANLWLQYQFGWMPLYSDIYGAVNQVQQGFRDESQLFSVTRRVSDSLSTWTSGKPYNAVVSGSSHRTHICKMYARIAKRSLFRANALGLVNPATVAWELVPFSFAVDWFLPIGNFLTAATSTMGLEFITGYTSCYARADWACTYDPGQWNGGVTIAKATTTTSTRGYSRYALTSFPGPRLYVKSPFSTSHVTTALALLASFRR